MLIPTSLMIDPDQKARLEKIAEKEGRSFGNLVRKILADWLKTKETKNA